MPRLTVLMIAIGTLCCTMAVAQPESGQVTTVIPLAGNTFFNKQEKGITLSDLGISQWTDASTEAKVFVRFLRPGEYRFNLHGKGVQPSTIRIMIEGRSVDLPIGEHDWKKYDAGTFAITDSGYVCFRLRGIQKQGAAFADVQSLEIEAEPSQLQFVKDDFYWGRRGPSVHLSYTMPQDKKIQWFYNEVTIPEGMDVIGSYYMANGFREGYFGIQVNSENERRILFSVWSPFKTDNPKSIPDSARVKLLAKGKDVYTGEFGNEGSGGQSYLKYSWRAGVTYAFLTSITPQGKATTYTSYFFDPLTGRWLLIASFLRPQTSTWYERPHSFLENFMPETGAETRKGMYGNQWFCDTEGKWTELTTARFTIDATGKKKARMDFAGGAEGDQFYLRNCGFFSSYTLPNALFERKSTGRKPSIAFNLLPKE